MKTLSIILVTLFIAAGAWAGEPSAGTRGGSGGGNAVFDAQDDGSNNPEHTNWRLLNAMGGTSFFSSDPIYQFCYNCDTDFTVNSSLEHFVKWGFEGSFIGIGTCSVSVNSPGATTDVTIDGNDVNGDTMTPEECVDAPGNITRVEELWEWNSDLQPVAFSLTPGTPSGTFTVGEELVCGVDTLDVDAVALVLGQCSGSSALCEDAADCGAGTCDAIKSGDMYVLERSGQLTGNGHAGLPQTLADVTVGNTCTGQTSTETFTWATPTDQSAAMNYRPMANRYHVDEGRFAWSFVPSPYNQDGLRIKKSGQITIGNADAPAEGVALSIQGAALRIDDLTGSLDAVTAQRPPLWIRSQNDDNGEGCPGPTCPGFTGNFRMEGGNWNNGHIVLGTGNLWWDETNDVFRVDQGITSGQAPQSETGGWQILTSEPRDNAAGDPCGSEPVGYAWHNTQAGSDYFCFCNTAGADVQMHSPATACY